MRCWLVIAPLRVDHPPIEVSREIRPRHIDSKKVAVGYGFP